MTLPILIGVIVLVAIGIIGYLWITGKLIDKAKVTKKKNDEFKLD